MRVENIKQSGFRTLSSTEIKPVSGGEVYEIVVNGNLTPPLSSGIELDNI